MTRIALLALALSGCVQRAGECRLADDDDSARADDCDDVADPYLDSDGDGWPDCADCAPEHVRVPRLEECPDAL